MTSSAICGRRSNTAGTTRPPIPLAVSATTRNGCIAPTSMNDTTWSANALSRLRWSTSRLGPPQPDRRPDSTFGGDRFDVFQASVLPDGTSTGQAQLDAVVLSRVVRRGEHRAGRIELAGGEVEQVGRGQAEVDDVDTLFEHAAGECVDELGTGRAHVATDQDPRCVGEAGEADPQRVGDVGVELIGDGAADVVRLDDVVEHLPHVGRFGRGHGA